MHFSRYFREAADASGPLTLSTTTKTLDPTLLANITNDHEDRHTAVVIIKIVAPSPDAESPGVPPPLFGFLILGQPLHLATASDAHRAAYDRFASLLAYRLSGSEQPHQSIWKVKADVDEFIN